MTNVRKMKWLIADDNPNDYQLGCLYNYRNNRFLFDQKLWKNETNLVDRFEVRNLIIYMVYSE